MPLPQNFNALLGAGVFGIVCAATLYVVEHYRQDRRRHAMAKDLARLDTELAVLRQELNSLLALQKQKASKKIKRKKVESILSSTTSEDYGSAVEADSSDLEFYDVSDDEIDLQNESNSNLFPQELTEIDLKLDGGNMEEVQSCLEKLQILCIQYPENPHLLWRIGKAHYKIFEKTEDRTLMEEEINKGVAACTSALNYKPEIAEVHKWLAALLGSRSQFQPIKEKIMDGRKFKEHLDAAIRLNPNDPSLHHMLGRFAYDVAELKWYERKVAAALFAEPPNATYEEALGYFEEAQKLSNKDWKENLLYIGKCKIKMNEIEEAVKTLKEADAINTDNGVDDAVDIEVKELLKKYSR